MFGNVSVNGNIVTVSMTGSTSNPLVPGAPPVYYDLSLTMRSNGSLPGIVTGLD
jgi:hypothetical protein